MSALKTNSVPRLPGGKEQIRAAVLRCFCDPAPEHCSLLARLSSADWRRLLRWLDTSGLALYFLDRLHALRLDSTLPPAILARLEQNLIDNTERTRAMIADSSAIQTEFQSVHLSYAVLKGFSLWPCSVPRPELRSQLDLDFLIAEQDAPEGRRVLERHGYRLHAVSGRSWEFKTTRAPSYSLADLYKARFLRRVELHLETGKEPRDSLPARTRRRDFHGVSMPVLPPANLFLDQGLHLFKHVCSEFSRAAHLLEFQRHLIARRDDSAFWREVRSVAGDHPRTARALGVVTLLVARTMGDCAPQAFSEWTVDCLPDAARLWVDVYGCRSVFADPPGSKLYLLLQREFEAAGSPPKRTPGQILFPFKPPPAILQAPEHESLPARIRRYEMQARFIQRRLRFHVVEGLRYMLESAHWRRRLKGYPQQFDGSACESASSALERPASLAPNKGMTIR